MVKQRDLVGSMIGLIPIDSFLRTNMTKVVSRKMFAASKQRSAAMFQALFTLGDSCEDQRPGSTHAQIHCLL